MNSTTVPTGIAAALQTVRDLNGWRLSHAAECGSPDSLTSPGAVFLGRVRDALLEAVEWKLTDESAETLTEALSSVDSDGTHELVDGAVPVYTHERWSAFVDLQAYSEDTDELTGGENVEMTDRAGIALYVIGERLATVLRGDLERAADELDDDEN